MLALCIYTVWKEVKNRKRWKLVAKEQLDSLVLDKGLKKVPLTAMPVGVKFAPGVPSLDLPFPLGKHHMVLRGTPADSKAFSDFAEESTRRRSSAGQGT
jgi:hypothetical protein